MAKGVVIGTDAVLANLHKEIMGIKGRTIAGLTAAAVHVSGETVPLTPVVTSNLVNSRYVIAATGVAKPSGGSFKDPGKKEAEAAHGRAIPERAAAVAKYAKGPFPRAEIGYSALYAAAVHENPQAGQKGHLNKTTKSGKAKGRQQYSNKGEWKFLETAVKANTTKILSTIREFAMVKK